MTPTAADEATTAAAPAAPAAATAGAALRRAREARGLHIAALAATLKVPQSKLEALESDRYQDLPDATFARALARSMCRVLKIEAEPVLKMLPSAGAEASLDRVTPGLNQPFRERAMSQDPMLSTELLKRPVVLGAGALLVAAIAVYAVPSTWVEQLTQRLRGTDTAATTAPGTTDTTATAEAPATTTEAPLAAASEAPLTTAPAASATTLPAPTTTVATTAVGGAPAATSPSIVSPAATNTAAAPAPNAPATPAATAPVAPPPGSSPLVVKASAESWVEVVDAKGQVLLSKLMRAGDQVDVNGVAPLKLRVGNVSGTELVFRGQPVDLAARSRDNVARLELN
ncbi:MAG: helix-turn-helix domain-containing protein [Mitsuaria chitosanitabida]|uniref:helix-turn-helix domain-containing protein n=1 Tax=Roseateles chitosanitabidus TaxID=65048 RepID=UPI001B2DDD40|nr:helix-turn-helix domain-containing protein [Roseateles chitosanitabidus]MBO9687351.1 helix-turn-helix domain-containing protein [Roseateles chitosanitabidus]